MRLFLTGGSGFIGRALIPLLVDRGHTVVVLTRNPEASVDGALRVIGDLLDPTSYRDAVEECGTVVHLAAATGRAVPEEHERVNARGTAALVETCLARGRPGFLFVSSVAAGFPDLTTYPYARSKAKAELAVRSSGLEYLIIRPTAVFGPGSPTFAGLWKLASLPVTPLFNNGVARIQPIHVGDLANHLAEAVEATPFKGEMRVVGGPEAVTMKNILLRLRRIQGRRSTTIAVPLTPVIKILRALEKVAPGRLPVTAGQLSSFRFDGISGPAGMGPAPPTQFDLEAMIEASIE